MDGAELLKQYAQGKRDFASSDLLETDLIAAELSGIDLSYADLRQCRLGRANFSQADFRDADLSEAYRCLCRRRNFTRSMVATNCQYAEIRACE